MASKGQTEKYIYMPFQHQEGHPEVSDTPRHDLPKHTCIQWQRPNHLLWPRDQHQILPRLQTDGAVIVKLLDDATCSELKNNVHQSLSQLFELPQSVDNRCTYSRTKNASAGRIDPPFRVSHYPTNWHEKVDPKLRQIFEAVYDDNSKLVPAMQGFVLHPPHSNQSDTNAPNVHTNTIRRICFPEHQPTSYPGILNFDIQDPSSGGFFFGLGSHKQKLWEGEFTADRSLYRDPANFPLPLTAWYLSPGDMIVYDVAIVQGHQVPLGTLKIPSSGSATQAEGTGGRLVSHVIYTPTRHLGVGQDVAATQDTATTSAPGSHPVHVPTFPLKTSNQHPIITTRAAVSNPIPTTPFDEAGNSSGSLPVVNRFFTIPLDTQGALSGISPTGTRVSQPNSTRSCFYCLAELGPTTSTSDPGDGARFPIRAQPPHRSSAATRSSRGEAVGPPGLILQFSGFPQTADHGHSQYKAMVALGRAQSEKRCKRKPARRSEGSRKAKVRKKSSEKKQ